MRYLFEAVFFLIYFTEADAIYIKEIGLYIPESLAVAMMGCLFIMWNTMFSVRKSCREKAGYEAAFFLLPIELFLLLIFAQYHVAIAGMVTVLLIVMPLFVINHVKMDSVKRDKYESDDVEREDTQENREREQLTAIHQKVILFACIILAIPSLIAGIVYV